MTSPPLIRYSLPARLLHWGMAVLLAGMVGLGFYATSLSYYDPLYHRSVLWHRGWGVMVFGLWWVRVAWRWHHPPPPLPPELPGWERHAAAATHLLLYLLILALPISGYLISTAEGRGVSVFGWFEVPALLPPVKGREEWAGVVHLGLALALCGAVALHVAAALKHHLIDRDAILRRMWYANFCGGLGGLPPPTGLGSAQGLLCCCC